MLLKKITIKGFKSFADKVEMEVERGITAVVGPNGCGKSNIADSINWALGEQSPTSLRGKRMDQMIFNGSSSRKAMGMAEVAITLKTFADLEDSLDFEDEDIEELERDGSDLHAILGNVENGEIVITRRMFRDSHSEYLINGKTCRLKDVQDLLMALGIGTRAITIVEQDRIASVISAKPVDRRVIIEDAAGITKFKVNRHLTNLKLDHARKNLERIEDLLGEQETQVRSLRQQAARARRYRALQEDIRNIEGHLIAAQHGELRRQHDELKSRIAALEEQHGQSQTLLTQAEAAEAELRQRIDELNTRKSHAREQHYQQNLIIDRDTNRLKHLRDGIDEMYRRSRNTSSRLEQSSRALEERTNQLEAILGETETLEKRVAHSAQQLHLLKEEADSADADLHELRERRERAVTEAADIREKRARETARLENLRADERRLKQAVANARAIIDRDRAGMSEWQDRSTHLEQRREDLEERLNDNSLEQQRCRQNLDGIKGELTSVERRLQSIRDSRGNAEATVSALEEMEAQHEGVEEAARIILTEKEIRNRVTPLGIVADFIEIDPDLSSVAVAAFSSELEAVVVADEEAAETGLAELRKRNAGRAGFVPLSRCSAPGAPNGDLRDALRPRGRHGEILLSIFPGAVQAGNSEEALQRSASEPGLRVVTPDGIVARNGRLLHGGSETVSAQIFSRRERMDSLRREIEGFNEELDRMTARRQDLEEKQEKQVQEAEDLRRKAEQMRLQQVELVAQAKAARKEHDRLSEAVESAQKEIQQFLNKAREATENRLSAEASLKDLESRLDEELNKVNSIEESLKEATAVAGAKRKRETELRTDVSTVEERLKSYRDRKASLERDIRQGNEQIAEARRELEEIEKQRKESLAEIETIEGGLDDKVQKARTYNEEVQQLNSSIDDLTQKLRAQEQEVKRHRREAGQAGQSLEQFRLDSREKILALEHLQQRAAENLKMSAEDLEKLEAPEEELSSEEALQKLADLKDKLERMGPVNLLADEEYEKQLKRFEDLSSQQQDVIDSIESLERVIERIDRVSRKRFKDAFDQINENFHRIFRILFGGGKAELMLGEGDLLTAGIEIMVQPPGKRNQSASLLSGGEKTLSAFSLILGVMEFRPTPFCILDESDAALDESNIRRIASLIADRAERTQFIVVTHNKTTMEIADRLYGVTMEEPGVSKLVSVQFN